MIKNSVALLVLFIVLNVPDTRQQLIDVIFGGNLPTRQPDLVQENISGSVWSGLPNLLKVTRITVRMDHNLYSVIDLLIPVESNGRLFVYHEGHGADPVLHRELMGEALARGFAVVGIAMPLAPVNGGEPVKIMPNGETWRLTNHGAFAFLSPSTGHPIRYFLEPVIILLNYTDTLGFSDVSMTGLSGGGWTTTLVAAIDSRIDRSYPVAGSLPLGIRYWYDWGDWEQQEADIYTIAGYEDLYLLGACNGRQLQILNRTDTCCFRADGREASYAPSLKARAADLSCSWDLWLDTYPGHEISLAAASRIFEDILGPSAHYLPALVK